MISSVVAADWWCHWIPIVEPAAMGHFLLAGLADWGKKPHVIFGSETKRIGLSKAVEGCGRTQSPSTKASSFKYTELKYVCANALCTSTAMSPATRKTLDE